MAATSCIEVILAGFVGETLDRWQFQHKIFG
ncbi:MAG: hypothetical protein ACI9UA_006236 [Pseudoalteromonas tetraodonis]|jgi:hypothetical protein